MTRRDSADLLLLAAIWGGSFLFMRLGAHEFGPLALVFLRVAGASLLLLPWLLWRGELGALRAHWRDIAVIGVLNSALPFTLFALGSLVLGAGLMAVFNATAPLWTALLAWAWLGERPAGPRLTGLALGFAGVLGLSWGQADLRAGAAGISPALAVLACLGASVLYGLAAILSRRRLVGVPPMAVAAGSQVASTLLMALPAWWWWPATPPSARAWIAALVLALVCTGLAYVLYFRLLANAGATNAISVTFLVPAFAMLWGLVFLGEWPTPAMLAGAGVILLGTGLATGLVKLPRSAPAS